MLGSAGGPGGVEDPRLARILLEGRESLSAYAEAEQILKNTLRQISQKQNAYERALEEERERAEELRRREKELDESIARMGAGKARMEARLQKLEAAERARVLRTMPATGGSGADLGYQIGIARDQIIGRVGWADPLQGVRKALQGVSRKIRVR